MSISYELAKELKDAGYAQDGDGHYFDAYGKLLWSTQAGTEPLVYQPTLAELIEAVKGVRIKITINGFEQHWNAFCSTTESASGSTPDEAVARLWLALNRRPIE